MSHSDNLPRRDLGLSSYPTVVMVIRLHLRIKDYGGFKMMKNPPERLNEGPHIAGMVDDTAPVVRGGICCPVGAIQS